MGKWTFVVSFDAASRESAENTAALLVAFTRERKIGRTALYYLDPLTGKQLLLAEPAMSAGQLAMYRRPE